MARVAVVVDSTADIPAPVRQDLDIAMVPLNVHFGDQVFKDQVEMDTEGFWRQLHASPVHPRTSQPAPGDFLAVYQRLAAEGRPVVSIHISAQLSGTCQSAQIAAGMVPGAQIEVVDSKSASLGFGLIAIGAARMAREGAPLDQVAAWCREVASRMHVFFGVDTLEFLARNGRIGRARALLGGILNIKPILTLEDGVVAPADKVRGKAKVLPRVLDLLAERIPPGRRVRAGVLHAQAPDEAQAWLQALQGRYQVVESYVAPIGPVIATHVGPGTVGAAVHEVL